jgi:DNA-binding NarL/FixJ family response regulator
MPGVTGFSALSWFVGNYGDKPVIIISANTHPDTVRRAIDHGAAAFLSKSSSTQEIGDTLKRVIDGERGLHPGLEIGAQGATLQALDVAEALASLTPQQFRVTSMLVEGMLNKQIAYELDVKEATVKAHMTEIFRKLGVQSRTQAVLAIGNLTVTPLEELERAPQRTH